MFSTIDDNGNDDDNDDDDDNNDNDDNNDDDDMMNVIVKISVNAKNVHTEIKYPSFILIERENRNKDPVYILSTLAARNSLEKGRIRILFLFMTLFGGSIGKDIWIDTPRKWFYKPYFHTSHVEYLYVSPDADIYFENAFLSLQYTLIM